MRLFYHYKESIWNIERIKSLPDFSVVYLGDVFDGSISRFWLVKHMEEISRIEKNHTYVVITKRIWRATLALKGVSIPKLFMMGVFVSNQEEADFRIPMLIRSGIRAVYICSLTPLKEKISIKPWLKNFNDHGEPLNHKRGLSMVIAGSGKNSKTNKRLFFHVLLQCMLNNVAMFFVGWGDPEGEPVTEKENDFFNRLKFYPTTYVTKIKQLLKRQKNEHMRQSWAYRT